MSATPPNLPARSPARPPALPAAAPPAGQDLPPWRPVAWRTRGWLLLGAAITALVIAWLMLQPKLRLMAARAERGEAPVPIGLPTEAHRLAHTPAASAPAHHGAPDARATEQSACGDRPAGGCVGGPMPIMVLPTGPASR